MEFHPAHVDGCTLVVMRQNGQRFENIAAGNLSYDGETLTLCSESGARIITDSELAAFQPVFRNNRIANCQGFDFFLLLD